MMTQQEIDKLQEKALTQLKSGQSLFGSDGAFAPMLQSFIEVALQAEMDAHLDTAQRRGGNKRNGKGTKTIKSSAGSFRIETPPVSYTHLRAHETDSYLVCRLL